MTCEEKTNYLRIGLGLSGVVVNDFTAEIIWRTVEGLQKKKGEFSVSDQVEIEMLVKGKLEKKKISLEENSKKSERISQRKKHQTKKFGHKEHKVSKPLVKSSDKTSIDSKNPKSKKDSNVLRFRNNKGHESSVSILETPTGSKVIFMVGGLEVLINRSQKKEILAVAKKYGIKSNALYEVSIEIANYFKSYRDASGKTIVLK